MPASKKQNRITYMLLLCLLLAGICTTIFAIASKKGMHVDEYYSYGLSNYNGDDIYMSVDIGKAYDDPEEPFLHYMTVPTDARFSYENVWKKQTLDVHPPFYYVLLHTICSFFPGEFSIWYAAAINIFFFAGMILLTYSVMQKLIRQNGTALIAAMLCALSGGLIQINTFLRMYTMLMFLTLLLTWLHVTYYKKQPPRFFAIYPIILLAGMLTHYYFLIFLLMQGIYFGFSLLLRKRWKSAFIYLTETVLTFGLAFVIFPAMKDHIFSGYRGKESLDNLASSSGYFTGLLDFLKIISKNLSGNLLYIIVFTFVGVFVYQTFIKKKRLQIPYDIWGMLLFTAGGFYLLISKIAVYHYDRYISPVYPILILIIAGMIYYLTQALLKSEKVKLITAVTLAIACIATSYFKCDWIYLQAQAKNAISAAKSNSDLDCLIINNGVNFWNHTLYFEAKNYQSVTFLSDTQLLNYLDTQVFQQKPIIVYIMNIIENPDAILQEMIRQNPSYSQYVKLPESTYSKGYLLK